MSKCFKKIIGKLKRKMIMTWCSNSNCYTSAFRYIYIYIYRLVCLGGAINLTLAHRIQDNRCTRHSSLQMYNSSKNSPSEN